MGLTVAARHAGTQAAMMATPPSSRPTATNVTGSSAGTPTNSPEMERVRTTAVTLPRRTPTAASETPSASTPDQI